eukprot:scaffold51873_cov69-Phaeocystis_antarctica.AAC.2
MGTSGTRTSACVSPGLRPAMRPSLEMAELPWLSGSMTSETVPFVAPAPIGKTIARCRKLWPFPPAKSSLRPGRLSERVR